MSGVYWRDGRECRYSGTRRGIGGMRGSWAPRVCWGIGAVRWLSGGVGGVRVVLGGWQGVYIEGI